jgi:uncharacterized repeat protein (TIGR01451 family)
MKKDKSIIFVIFILMIATLALSIAFSSLSTLLNINYGDVNQSAQTWDVGFDTSGSPLAASSTGTSAAGRICGAATITKDSVSVADTQLSKPGDTCTWSLTIQNLGTIDAELNSVTPIIGENSCTISGSSMECGNITYKLATDQAGTTLLSSQINSTLAKTNGTKDVYLIATYSSNSIGGSSNTQSGIGFTILYNQK